MTDPRATALEDCLQRLQAGASVREVLERYPQWADDLRPRLEAARAAQALGETLQVPQATIARGRARFLKQIYQPSPPRPQPSLKRLTWLRASLATVLVLMFAFSGVVFASAEALPGEALHPIKLAVEQMRLRLARDLDQRLALEAEFDRERLQETRTVLDRQRAGQVTLVGVLTQTAPETWQVDDIPVMVSPALASLGQTFVGFQVVAVGVVQLDGGVLVETLSLREFQLTGPLESFTSEQWVIDEVTVALAPETIVQGIPVVGQPVSAQAVRRADGLLLARRLEVIGSPTLTPSRTRLVSPTASHSPSAMPDSTSSITPSMTATVTRTPTPSAEPSQTPTGQSGETVTPTITPVASETPSFTRTPESSETPEPTEEPEPSEEPQGTEEPESTQEPEPTERPEPSETP